MAKAVPSFPALELYEGDHWAVARELPEIARAAGFRPSLWVASAGYGLVPTDVKLASYSATFAAASPDTVILPNSDPRAAPAAWWRALSRRRLRGSDAPRQLAELTANSNRRTAFLVVVSTPYLRALGEDLVTAAGTCGDSGRMIVVTSHPGPAAPSLRDAWVPAAAPLRLALGGSLTSLHARVARHLLAGLSPTTFGPRVARETVKRLLARTPDLPQFDRARLDDGKVCDWIRAELKRDQSVSHTQLLRRFRDAGNACEQARFRGLFTIEKESGR